ncbi:MAG: hypothetical protein FJX78_04380 [Armatimonadetes bacterium]|nr:hypothetical protein [Armatimonadota bacterium]
MKIGNLAPQAGQKSYGTLVATQTRGQFAAEIPLHVVRGARHGPALVVQAGVSGLEIEPSMVLPSVAEELNPAEMSGTLVLVPLLNTSGFEFEQANAIWDDTNLHEVGRGRADGTVSEQLVDRYYRDVIAPADAVLDVRTGAKWGYFRYAGVYETASQERSRTLATALGLPHVLLGQPAGRTIACEAARDGKAVVSVWVGGGPGLRDHRESDLRRIRNAVRNALRSLGMLRAAFEGDTEQPMVVSCHTVLRHPGARGFTFIDKSRRGTRVDAGQSIGQIVHPFTGDVLTEVKVPRDGFMIDAGASWPVVPDGYPLAILGDIVS